MAQKDDIFTQRLTGKQLEIKRAKGLEVPAVAAEMLGLSKSTVSYWARNDMIPRKQSGRIYLVDIDDVKAKAQSSGLL